MRYIKKYESLEERTEKSFKRWYLKVKPFDPNKDNDEYEYEYQLESALKGWLIYKPYFEDKNIYSYKTYSEYEIAFKNAKAKYAGKLKNVQEGIDYKIIYEDEKVRIIKPLTLKGSCKYGFNTKWCTTMIERPEHFDSYKRDGELYRFIFSENEKYSLHWANNGNKFWRDQEDEEINKKLIYTDDRFILSDTPFELSSEAKLKVSIDFVTVKWDNYFCRDFRKKKKINTIEDYIRYYEFAIEY